MEKITILIVEDHALLRETWNSILNKDERFEVVGTCGNGYDAIEQARQLCPNVVIMDINLPGLNGVEATQLIRKVAPESSVLAVSIHNQPAYAKKMFAVGAKGYVTKNSSTEEMVKAIIEIHNGGKYICDEIKTLIINQHIGEAKPEGLLALSPREIEIVSLLKKGESSKDIAKALNISVQTVSVHRYHVLKKLNLKNVAALINFAHNKNM